MAEALSAGTANPSGDLEEEEAWALAQVYVTDFTGLLPLVAEGCGLALRTLDRSGVLSGDMHFALVRGNACNLEGGQAQQDL